MSDSDLEKTEEATPEKKKKAREEGQFPRSKDGASTAASLALIGAVALMGTYMIDALRELALHCFGGPEFTRGGAVEPLGREALSTLGKLVLPAVTAAMLGAVIIGFAEAGIHPSLKLAAPKWERLNPLDKLKQQFSPLAIGQNILLSLARVAAVVAVSWMVLRGELPTLIQASRATLVGASVGALHAATRLAIWATLALAALSGVDYLISWWKHNKQIRMTRQELKDEFKQQEGNPEVKARRRARARELAMRGLVKQVREADVVVVNPTHVAVVLRYRPELGAPIVSAKGYDDVALRIRELAKEFSVPIVENKPLARGLASAVRVGRMIPVEMYSAVAEVLAFVMRLKNRGLRA